MMSATRRSLFTGALAVAALGGSAALAAPADPVFAAIERHKATWKAFSDFCDQHVSPNDVSGWDDLNDADEEALDALSETAPTTAQGAQALASYMAAHANGMDIPRATLIQALASISWGLERNAARHA